MWGPPSWPSQCSSWLYRSHSCLQPCLVSLGPRPRLSQWAKLAFRRPQSQVPPEFHFSSSTRPLFAWHHHLSRGLPIASACTQLPPHGLRNFSQEPRLASQLHDRVRGVRGRLVAAPVRPLHRVEAPFANMTLSWVSWNSCWNILYFCTEFWQDLVLQSTIPAAGGPAPSWPSVFHSQLSSQMQQGLSVNQTRPDLSEDEKSPPLELAQTISQTHCSLVCLPSAGLGNDIGHKSSASLAKTQQ